MGRECWQQERRVSVLAVKVDLGSKDSSFTSRHNFCQGLQRDWVVPCVTPSVIGGDYVAAGKLSGEQSSLREVQQAILQSFR
jgi:hypothetical protein